MIIREDINKSEIYSKLGIKYGIPAIEVKKIVESQFACVKDQIEKDTDNLIILKYLGKFRRMRSGSKYKNKVQS